MAINKWLLAKSIYKHSLLIYKHSQGLKEDHNENRKGTFKQLIFPMEYLKPFSEASTHVSVAP